MSDVVQKLWGFCHTLRHDGIDYGDYIEQLTYLLFLKMADERSVELPADCGWQSLTGRSGTDLADHYVDVLRTLGRQPGLLGDIFAGAQSRFQQPGQPTPDDRADRRDGVDRARRGREGRGVRGAAGEGSERGEEGRRAVFHAPPADPVHRQVHEA